MRQLLIGQLGRGKIVGESWHHAVGGDHADDGGEDGTEDNRAYRDANGFFHAKRTSVGGSSP